MVITLILAVQFVISAELLYHGIVTDILVYQGIVNAHARILVQPDHLRQIFPPSCSNISPAVHRVLNKIEVFLLKIKEADYCGVYALFKCILLPCPVIRFNIHDLKPVKYGYIEFADRLVEFGRITGRHYHPAVRYSMPPEHFILQELQH